jgi:hypothetical protein
VAFLHLTLRTGFAMQLTKLGRALVLFLVCAPAQASDRYYMIVFGSETNVLEPQTAHTFASFIKTTDAAPQKPEVHTISWLPASLEVVVWRRFPEPGKNFDLKTTLKWAKDAGAQVVYWGPYEIKKELYDMALKQEEKLQGGKIAYKALDLRFRPQASNCIHAVADIDTKDGRLYNGATFGAEASNQVTEHLKSWIVNPGQEDAKVFNQLGIDDLGITFRSMNDSRKSVQIGGRAP